MRILTKLLLITLFIIFFGSNFLALAQDASTGAEFGDLWREAVLVLIQGGVVAAVVRFVASLLPKGLQTLISPFIGWITKAIEKAAAEKLSAEQLAATLELNRKQQAAEIAVKAVEQMSKRGVIKKDDRLKAATESVTHTINSDNSNAQIKSKDEARILIESAVARKKELDAQYEARARAEFEAMSSGTFIQGQLAELSSD